MTNHKKEELIIGMSSDPENKLVVQKSMPLLALWRSSLSLAEFKILDSYLARIDSRNPNKRSVRFEKGTLEQLLGVKKINISDLKSRLKHLMENVVEVDDPTGEKSFRLVSLFEQAECEQDENGLWQIELECTQRAMKYFFNIENLGYLRYKLRAIVNLTSRYSYILFLYIEHNRFRKTWEVSVADLKNILHCQDELFYEEFRYFNQRILQKCRNELLKKTECRFSYELVKTGRKVVAIRFIVETIPLIESEQIDGSQDFNLYGNDIIEFLRSACCPSGSVEPEFSRSEMEEIYAVMVCIPECKLPYDPSSGTDLIDFRRYHYLSMCYAKMNRVAEKKPIKNRLAYISKIIRTDAGIK